jgi:TRAP-type mannitol/chloroaromatic compound transport system permease small subunit
MRGARPPHHTPIDSIPEGHVHQENPKTSPPAFANAVVNAIDKANGFLGKAVSLLILPMSYILVHEVVSRYFFHAPTVWAGDLSVIMYGIFFMIASPMCLRDGIHIRTDFLYSRWTTKTKGLVDFFIYLIMYIPVHIVFLDISWHFFYKSFLQNEKIVTSPWMPIIWPLKFAIPAGIFLMLLQGISETIKSYYMWRHGEYYWLKAGHGADDDILTTCTTQET